MPNNKIEVSFKLEDIPLIIETLEKIQNENEKYKQALLDIKEIINKQLLSNTNITKYTDEMCLKDLKDIVNEALGDKEQEEIPLFEGTLEQLNNLSIIGDKE